MIGDMVKESHNAIVRQMLPKPVLEQSEKIVVPRPPLPPNMAVKSPKGRPLTKKLLPLSATVSADAIPQSGGKGQPALTPLAGWPRRAPMIAREKCAVNVTADSANSEAPAACDANNNNNMIPLSRNSSVQSIDSLSSFRSMSPTMSLHSSIGSLGSRQSLGSLTPRRIYPQAYKPSRTIDLSELHSLDKASAIFDGKLSFVLGCKRQPVRQQFRSSAAHLSEADTASRYLSDQISGFLRRTDHIAEEWSARGKSQSRGSVSRRSCDLADDDRRLGRSKSVTNIMIKGYQLAKSMPPTERSGSVCRDRCSSALSDTKTIDDDQCTLIDADDVVDEVTTIV